MSVIDNGGMGSIKKQIFFLLGLFFSCSNLGAMCPQTVGAVMPGEAIWQVTSRIGQATNIIQSQICALSAVNSECSFTFGQADIGSGGIYTISVPGTYCMTENVTFTFDAAITVSSSDVTIDMRGHTLSGADNSTTGILLVNGIQNVIVENGIIEHIGGTIPNGVAIRDTVGATQTLQNITIRDMNFNNNNQYAINLSLAAAPTFDVTVLLIENCRAFDSGPIQFTGFSGIVQGCIVEEDRSGVGFGGNIFAKGPSAAVVGASFVIQDCVTTGSFGVNAAFVQITNAANALIRNCVSQGSLGVGISMASCQDMVISDCISQGSSGFSVGIAVSSPLSGANLVIERSIASNHLLEGFNISNGSVIFSAVTLIDCIADSNTGHGFVITQLNSSDAFSNITLKGCSAAANDASGFALILDPTRNNISQIVFDDCIAQGNSGDGFSLVNQNAASVIQTVAFRNCISQANVGGTYSGITYLGDGFGIGSASTNVGPILDVVCQNCVAQNNTNDGFDFGATATSGSIDTVSCQYCTAQENDLHGMNFSSTATNCQVYMSLMANNGGNGINNLNPVFGPSSANRFISNRSFRNAGVDYFQINDGVNGQPFYSSSDEALVQGASAWANLAT